MYKVILEPDITKRADIKKLVNHKWFANLKFIRSIFKWFKLDNFEFYPNDDDRIYRVIGELRKLDYLTIYDSLSLYNENVKVKRPKRAEIFTYKEANTNANKVEDIFLLNETRTNSKKPNEKFTARGNTIEFAKRGKDRINIHILYYKDFTN